MVTEKDVINKMIGMSQSIWLIMEEMYNENPRFALEDILSTMMYFCEKSGLKIRPEAENIRQKINGKT